MVVCRWAAVALIQPPLAWELPYAVGGALKRKKKMVKQFIYSPTTPSFYFIFFIYISIRTEFLKFIIPLNILFLAF